MSPRTLIVLLAFLLPVATAPMAAAAERGAPQAKDRGATSSLNSVTVNGVTVTTSNRPGSASMVCEAAENGDAGAAYTLARRYLFGIGVRRDRNKGAAWLRAAAERGHADARRMINHVPKAVGRFRPYCRPGGGPVRALAAPPAEIVAIVREMAPTYGLDPDLVLAIIQTESAFRTDAVSPKAAAGLMQLIPDTADRFGVRDVFDPKENIRGGMKYLRWLLAYFQGNVNFALAGYNAGEGAVDRYKGIPPYEETQSYVRLIRRLYGPDRHPFDPSVAGPSALAGKTSVAQTGD
ncbi:lytic transglycosylase domain-containing protein [Azospirillum sp. SYSU D00513]|uniref:lytic transglycosylase domain-containing protein n=1 Tax=Azospirillum sp. SYSU D00513 TaxID=2812561 RepID=UPI001FFEDCDE|nr:lytic transglycosylase domain-containing protein [Azospirillum sp. SYSU D00513]